MTQPEQERLSYCETYPAFHRIANRPQDLHRSAAVDKARSFSDYKPDCAITYFYYSIDDRQTQEPVSILGSILAQLLSQILEGFQGIERSITSRDQSSSENVHDLILKYLRMVLCCVMLFDAISECYSPEGALQELVDLAERAQNVMTIVTSTSRPFLISTAAVKP
jgi:hypothetical protein